MKKSHFQFVFVIFLGALLCFAFGCQKKAERAELEETKHNFGELEALAHKYGTDKGNSSHHYTETYEYFFYPIKYSGKKIFEIGIEQGASLKMWRDYFPNAVIYGIDILDTSKLNSDTIKTFVADQGNRKNLQNFINTFGGEFDIILDDGGHTMELQQISFGYLFKYVKPGGYYIIEDVHTSFMPNFGAEKDGSNTTFLMISDFISHGKINSKYLTQAEIDYLAANIDYCNLLSHDPGSITCIFKKK
jgi:hypothetical protein